MLMVHVGAGFLLFALLAAFPSEAGNRMVVLGLLADLFLLFPAYLIRGGRQEKEWFPVALLYLTAGFFATGLLGMAVLGWVRPVLSERWLRLVEMYWPLLALPAGAAAYLAVGWGTAGLRRRRRKDGPQRGRMG